MLKNEIFIIKCFTVNRFTSHSIVIGKVSSLDHEVWEDVMEICSLVGGLIDTTGVAVDDGCGH